MTNPIDTYNKIMAEENLETATSSSHRALQNMAFRAALKDYALVPLFIGDDVAGEVSYHKSHGGGFYRHAGDFTVDKVFGGDK